VDPKVWIDPDVLARAGISDAEAALYQAPPAYAGPSPVPQPPYDPATPHMAYPKPVYERLLAMSDEELTRTASYAEPPVRQPA
jgi:hypothetical protein